MKTLQNLLDATPGLIESQGDTGKPVSGVVFDSRKVQPGNVFVAVKGRQTDGHQYIDMALQKGAAAIVGEWLPAERPGEVCFVRVLDSAESLGWMAARWYDFPSRRLKLVGVTGTNGKTTTATLLHKLYSQLGFKTGLLSTVENKIGNAVLPSAYTTPDAVQLQGLLHEMAEAGCSHAFMEVSSHAIDQRRIAGLDFAGGIFTNITHDHLDYHGTFDAYLQAKKKFFDDLKTNAFALVNIDDRRGMVMVQNTNAVIRRYSLHRLADFKAKVLENTLAGLHLELDGVQVFTRLIGDFNAYNLLAVYGAACMLGESREEILPVLSNLTAAEGRFDYLLDPKRNIAGVVDYAHTPDALEKILGTLQQLRRKPARILTVVGCGGDRDRAKRPVMARIACLQSDQAILTSDNPRSEDPEAILREMEAGIPEVALAKVLTITDRRQAIRTACRLAKPGDIVLIAGKGHEKYQEIKGVRHPFDDKEELRKALEMNT